MTLGADVWGRIDDLELVFETDCERLKGDGVKGESATYKGKG